MLLGMAAIGANYQYEKEIAYNFHRAARLSIISYVSVLYANIRYFTYVLI